MKIKLISLMKHLALLFLALTTLEAQTLTFGVFSGDSSKKIMEEYQPVAEHISQELNVDIIVKPLRQGELENELKAGKIDIVVTNPTHYLSLQKEGRTSGAVVTLIKNNSNIATSYFGGVIISRADSDIRLISELRGKRVAIAGKKYLGGYQTQEYELKKAAIDIENDASVVVYGTYTAVVNAVLSQKADAGFIRTGILEEMVAQNRLSQKELFIIHEQKISYFPLRVSTKLYPEWLVVASKELEIGTVSKIAVALYSYKNLTGGSSSIYGFTIPGDYSEIDTLARTLRIAPYNNIPSFTHEDIWKEHSIDIMLPLFVMVLFFILLGVFYRRIGFKKKYIQSILNAAPTPIIVTNGASLIAANSAFLNFVGFATVEAFKSKYNCICDLFEEGDTKGYLRANMNGKTWVEYIIENPECEHKAKITIDGITTFFKVKVSVVQNKGLFRAIAIFDDISQLLSKSSTDALTHIANRTHFNLLFEHSLYIAKREKTPLSLIFFDIDHFKAVNDTYGHLVGDDILYHLANLVKNSLRKSDIVARWGGEEFIIILPNTVVSYASDVAEKLRKVIESDDFALVQHITCSFGVTQLQEGEEGEKLLSRLDELLYSAKENGRNRVEAG